LSTNIIQCESIIPKKIKNLINKHSSNDSSIINIIYLLKNELNIDATLDKDIVKSYERDYSNISGKADALVRPSNDIECAICFYISHEFKIPLTISAGRTNLNGSATPMEGIVLSTEKMISPKVKVDLKNNTAISPVGIQLESLRNEIQFKTQKKLYYPVDPTSRNDAMVGGTLSCNASGFVPGEQGATRFWVYGLEIILPNGYKVSFKRNQYVSKNGFFIFNFGNDNLKMKVPTYKRPKIKNASGPYSDENGKIDLVDLMIGSEGIFGFINSVIFNLKKQPDDFLDIFFTLKSENDAVNFYHYINKYLSGDLSKITALEYFGHNCINYMNNKDVLFKSSSYEVGIYLQVPLYNTKSIDQVENWYNILDKSKCNIDMNNIFYLNDLRDWEMFFQARHSIPENALKKTKKYDTVSILTDTIVPSKNFNNFLEYTHQILKNAKIEYLLFGHLGDCHLHFHLIPKPDQVYNAKKIYQKIVRKTNSFAGVYSAEHGTGKRKRQDFLECFGESAVKQIRAAKKILDPNLLLNRGNVFN